MKRRQSEVTSRGLKAFYSAHPHRHVNNSPEKVANRKQREAEAAYRAERMTDIRSGTKFPDWSYIWLKERSRRISNEKYAAMPPDERKARNRILMDNRCPVTQAATLKAWKEKNREKHLASVQSWRDANPEKIRGYAKKARKGKHRPWHASRKRFKEVMRRCKIGKSVRHSDLIGCSPSQFRTHLESKFKRGMTWENYGTYWHVDHILPCASFDQTNPAHRAACWHWTNLQPLESVKNMAKSDKITHPQMSLLLTL